MTTSKIICSNCGKSFVVRETVQGVYTPAKCPICLGVITGLKWTSSGNHKQAEVEKVNG